MPRRMIAAPPFMPPMGMRFPGGPPVMPPLPAGMPPLPAAPPQPPQQQAQPPAESAKTEGQPAQPAANAPAAPPTPQQQALQAEGVQEAMAHLQALFAAAAQGTSAAGTIPAPLNAPQTVPHMPTGQFLPGGQYPGMFGVPGIPAAPYPGGFPQMPLQPAPAPLGFQPPAYAVPQAPEQAPPQPQPQPAAAPTAAAPAVQRLRPPVPTTYSTRPNAQFSTRR